MCCKKCEPFHQYHVVPILLKQIKQETHKLNQSLAQIQLRWYDSCRFGTGAVRGSLAPPPLFCFYKDRYWKLGQNILISLTPPLLICLQPYWYRYTILFVPFLFKTATTINSSDFNGFVVCLCVVLHPNQDFSLIWRCEGFQILTYTPHSWPLSSEGSLVCHTYCEMGHMFIVVISEDPCYLHLLLSARQWSCHNLY